MKLIAAVDANWGIGYKNTLPWSHPEDLAHFKRLTTGSTIIMGRNTFESLPRVLPNRRHVVLTTGSFSPQQNVEYVSSVDEIVAKYDADSFVIGGGTVYRQLFPYCNEMYITYMYDEYNCDAHFPADLFKPDDWQVCDDSIPLDGAAICHYKR